MTTHRNEKDVARATRALCDHRHDTARRARVPIAAHTRASTHEHTHVGTRDYCLFALFSRAFFPFADRNRVAAVKLSSVTVAARLSFFLLLARESAEGARDNGRGSGSAARRSKLRAGGCSGNVTVVAAMLLMIEVVIGNDDGGGGGG